MCEELQVRPTTSRSLLAEAQRYENHQLAAWIRSPQVARGLPLGKQLDQGYWSRAALLQLLQLPEASPTLRQMLRI